MKKRFTVKASSNMTSRKRGKKIMAASGNDYYTENIADFGFREIEELRDILDAWVKNGGLPDDFYDEGVRPAFNRASGNVFLTNDDYQVCMLTSDGTLESFYSTPYSGHEGFYDDLMYEVDDSWDEEDIQYLRDIAESRGDEESIEKLDELLGNQE
jgi:hypothetical protein